MPQTEKRYPPTSGIPISGRRRTTFEDEVRRAFEGGINHRVIERIPFQRQMDPATPEFVKFGYNSVLPRVPFVEGPFNGVDYAVEGMGYPFGQSLADGETKYIVDQILHHPSIHVDVDTENELSDTLLYQEATRLVTSGFAPASVITSIPDELRLWWFPSLRIADGKLGIPASLIGSQEDVRIYFTRILPEGVTLLLGRQAARMVVKTPLTIQFHETINDEERTRIISQNPTLTNADLNERIRMLVFEVVRFELSEAEGVRVIRSRARETVVERATTDQTTLD